MHIRFPGIRRRPFRLSALAIAASVALGGAALVGPGAGTAMAAGDCGTSTMSVVVDSGGVLSYLCGTNFRDNGWGTVSEVMPLTNNRVWLHQYPSTDPRYSSGWADCYYGTTTILDPLVNGTGHDLPGNILVSANTSPC